jgi:hypothetical protein
VIISTMMVSPVGAGASLALGVEAAPLLPVTCLFASPEQATTSMAAVATSIALDTNLITPLLVCTLCVMMSL